ncbi:uncharacterized protein LOC142644424 [Castanea sativa]|uniref:uncharacterized protein LOC142644424 n=1 Tax=Castanea sativa TaxID=21020 RepID=UPI003F64A4AF
MYGLDVVSQMDGKFLEWVIVGGLVLAWMHRPNLRINFVSNHLIHIDLLDNKGVPVSITFVYGLPEHARREEVCIVGARLFQEVISNLQLCDLAATGQKYTWMNNREENEFVMERLDRAFATLEWVNRYLLYSLRNLPIIRSDHGPILLDFELQTPFRPRPFRFEFMLTTHPNCKSMIQQAWSANLTGSRAAQLRCKILNVKKIAVQWNKFVFGKVGRDIKLKQAQLQQLQDSLGSIEDVRKDRQLRCELEDLMNKKELMWAQKARAKWILQGDRNTKYFQTVVKQRKARNRILQIKDPARNTTDNLMEIESILVGLFKNCFDNNTQVNLLDIVQDLQSLPIPSLSDQHRSLLNAPITSTEIENTVFQLGSHKAPGPDGLPAFFF